MKKLMKLYSLALTFGLSYSVANAQTEGAARMPETEGTTIVVEKTTVSPKENNTIVVESKAKPAKIVETNTENIEYKNLDAPKKIVKGDRIKKHLKPEKKEQTNVSKNVKLGLILILVGLVLGAIFWGGFYWLGGLLVLVGIIIIILDVIDEL